MSNSNGGNPVGPRIGYLVPDWPNQTHTFFWRELTAMRALGGEIHVFSTRRAPDSACLHAFAKDARAETHYVFPPDAARAAKYLATRPRALTNALGYIARLSETPPKERARLAGLIVCAADLASRCQDLRIEHLHVHSCADAAHLAGLCRILGGPPFSLTLHGDLPVYGRDHRIKMAGAQFVSVVTRPLQKQVMDVSSKPQSKVPVIWMGVDTARFFPVPHTKSPAGSLTLVTVARLNPTKGHIYALKAIRKALNQGLKIRYIIAGEGPHRAQIEADIASLDLGDVVTLAGSLSEDGVLKLLQESDAFILSSEGLGEAAPVSVMEAMSCGLPVICSRIGGTADMIGNGIDGILVGQRDVDAIATAIECLAADQDFRLKLSTAARTRALEAFNYRTMAKKLLDAIKQDLTANSGQAVAAAAAIPST